MNNVNPLVSVLIPVYQRETFISQTIECVLKQTYGNIEIVIVDNASSDHTYDICRVYADKSSSIRLYKNDKNIGPVNNWRRCLELAKGKYAKILWSDDLMSHDYIEKTLQYLNDDVGFVFTSVIIDDSFDKGDRVYYKYGDSGLYPSMKYIDDAMLNNKLPVSPGCAIFRLSDLRKNLVDGIESPSFSDFANHGAGPDLLLFLLTALDYPYIGFVNEPLSFFREHRDSISLTMRRLDLYDRYQQAKIWFANNNLPTSMQEKLSILTWVQRMRIARQYICRKELLNIYGNNMPLPSIFHAGLFLLKRTYRFLFLEISRGYRLCLSTRMDFL